MDPNGPEAQIYLTELYHLTAGDLNAQVSMYDVGDALNMDKTDAGKLAEDLIGNGLVEVKTLSGGIGITALGIEKVQAAGLAGDVATGALSLGNGSVLEAEGKQAVATVLQDIRSALGRQNAPYDRIEEIVIDIKTLEVQLLSPSPKTAIVREVLRSMGQSLGSAGCTELSDTIDKMITK